MTFLIITDIFGLCSATDKLQDHLKSQGAKVIILDPYQGQCLDFIDAGAAYLAFIKDMGHEAFYQAGLDLVKKTSPTCVIGFSAGASVAWRLVANHTFKFDQVVCFYPSQIRHHSQLQPSSPCRLILPSFEASFDVKQMADKLSHYSHLEVIKSNYGHGFMNPKSAEYRLKAETEGYQMLGLETHTQLINFEST